MASFIHDHGNVSHDTVDPYDFNILEQGEEHNAYIPIGGGDREGKQNVFVTGGEYEEEEYSFHSSDFSDKNDGGAMVGLDFDDLDGNSDDDPPEVDKKVSQLVSGLDRGTTLPKKYGETEDDKGGTSFLPSELESSERRQASSDIYRDFDRNDAENMSTFRDRDDQPITATMENFSLREDHQLTTSEENIHITAVPVERSAPRMAMSQMEGNEDNDVEEENDYYSNEEFEEDQEDSSTTFGIVGAMQSSSSSPIQLRGQKDRRSDNKCESDYSGAAEAAASLEGKSGIDVHHANGGECMTEKSESDYASESWFEEETVTTCEGDQKGKIFNEEMNDPPLSPGRGSSTRAQPQPPHPTLASKHIQTITTRPSTSSSYTVIIDRSELQRDEDQPALMENIPIKAQASTEATLHYDFDPVKKVYRRSCGTQFSGNTAAVQANILSIGMIGATSSLDRRPPARHRHFLQPCRGGTTYIGHHSASNTPPPHVPSLPDPSLVWAMSNPPNIPFYPCPTHIESLRPACMNYYSSPEIELANDVCSAAPTASVNEVTSTKESRGVTAVPGSSMNMNDYPTPLAVSEMAFRRQLMLLRDNLKRMKYRAELICTEIPSEQYSQASTLMGTQRDITMDRHEPLGMDEALKRIDLAY